MKRCFVILLLAALTSLPRPPFGGRSGHQGACLGSVSNGYQAFGVENVVCVTKKGKKYHTARCRVLKDAEVKKMSKSEAEGKGYTPCKICKP